LLTVQPISESDFGRALLVRRGLRLNYLTIAYNAGEAVASLAAGIVAGSVALIAFGVDSLVELSASAAAQWRLRADFDEVRRAQVERTTRRIIGWCFIALAAYVTAESVRTVWFSERPDRSIAGIIILGMSVIVMPLLARKKRNIANELSSNALRADARQTSLCAYLSAIALGGVFLNASAGLWWADPLAALCMVPIIAKEGIEGLRADELEKDQCC
jgi:divalent metal cation (Fe/Co/Zn/Cd) transporter